MKTSKTLVAVVMALVLIAIPLSETAADCDARVVCSFWEVCDGRARDDHGKAVSRCNKDYGLAAGKCNSEYIDHGDESKLASCLARATSSYWGCIWSADFVRDQRIRSCCSQFNHLRCSNYDEYPCARYFSVCF